MQTYEQYRIYRTVGIYCQCNIYKSKCCKTCGILKTCSSDPLQPVSIAFGISREDMKVLDKKDRLCPACVPQPSQHTVQVYEETFIIVGKYY